MFSKHANQKIICSALALSLLGGCAIFDKKDTDEESGWLLRQFEKDGQELANRATVAYSKGDFKKTQELVSEALKDNPRNQQALLVGALAAEKLGRINRARQYYEDLIIIGGDQTSVLGSSSGAPQKIADIAKERLRAISIKQSEIVIEDKNGTKVFNISQEAASAQSQKVITRALVQKNNAAAAPRSTSPALDLFTPEEQNIITRFLTLKELAEKDLITKEEFLTRRQTNIGGLLPLTHKPGAAGIDAPVPSPDLIIERINVLKEAVESRAITPREFSAERDIIIEALMPPSPRTRMKPKAPSKDILGAAKDLRKLEALYDLNLITSKEKAAEKKAIEKYLGINRAQPKPAPAPAAVVAQPKPVPAAQPAAPAQETGVTVPQPEQPLNTVEKIEKIEVIQPLPPAPAAEGAPTNIVPNVTLPF